MVKYRMICSCGVKMIYINITGTAPGQREILHFRCPKCGIVCHSAKKYFKNGKRI